MSILRSGKPAVFACIVVLVTQLLPAAEPQLFRRAPINRSPGILDVALADGGTLRGTLVDGQGIRLPHRTVVISQQRRVAETRADAQGEFKLNGLCGGMYVMAVDGGQQACRLWAPSTAPPCAIDDVLIVSGGDAVRGQLGGHCNHHQWLTENAGHIALIATFIALPVVYATKPYGS